MENIPGDMLAETLSAGRNGAAGTAGAVLRTVAEHHTIRADKLRAQRTRGWKSASDELDGVARHLTEYADALADHFALYGSDVPPPTEPEPHPNAVPGLPGNTGRCASFRRATPGDGAVCALERGHDGNHVTEAREAWPRQHSGAVCGDVVILPDGTALNCARPLGHDGDEHYDGRYRLWPRGVGTSRQVRTCERCNLDKHECPGCGEPLNHFVEVCEACTRDEHGGRVEAPLFGAGHSEPLDYDGMCADQQDDAQPSTTDMCMLPTGHTGVHIGKTGQRWGRAVAEPATLAEIAEQQRAVMAPTIPEQRSALDGKEAPEMALTPAAVMVAEIKEEVSATVAELTGDEPAPRVIEHATIRELNIVSNPLPQLAFTPANDYAVAPVVALSNPFAPPKLSEGHDPLSILPPTPGEFPALGNPFRVAPPPAPKAELLPPHLVPGAPKPHQSVSSIQMMSECALRYRLKYRDGLAEYFTAWWNVGGTAWHKTVEHIERSHAESGGALYSITEPVFKAEGEAAEVWREMFAAQILAAEQSTGTGSTEWRAAKGGKEDGAWWRASGEDMVRRYMHHRVEFLKDWRLLTTPAGGFAQEVEFNADIHGVVMKGFIDSAWISADGSTIRVEDYKSGSSEGDPFQLKTYGAVLRAMGADIGADDTPRRIVGTFYQARKGAPAPLLELTTADDAEVSYRANTAQAMDRAGIFPANPSPANCSTCPVSNSCPVMAMKG